MGRVVVNHLGHCVTDLARSRSFYEEVLGFQFWREIAPPDVPSGQLLALDGALGLHACYLTLDSFVLELLHFAAPEHSHGPERRAMDAPGFTHLSISCDVGKVCAKVEAHGGIVEHATNVGVAVFIRDPDGQLIELLPLSYADHIAAGA